jgi:tetratricopeptide (TPR) repeat protein
LILLILTAILVPTLIVVLVEAGLRLAHVGFNTDVTAPCTMKSRAAYCDNIFFTSKFFPPRMIRLPRPYAIPAQKAPNTYRIFVLGESAAFGDPEPSYSFSRYLEVMLRARYPGRNFEVINTSVTAINSHVILPIARDMAKRQPDLFVIYMGNNEVVGPFGAGTVLTSTALNLPTIRATIALKSTRIGQLIAKAVTPAAAPQQWGGMEMFLDKQVRQDAPEMAVVYSNFRANLKEVISAARNAGAQVLVSTVVTNLRDCAPFASSHRRDLSQAKLSEWERLVDEATQAEASGSYKDALKLYEQSETIDGTFADIHFRMARILVALGDYVEARKQYVLAQDLDTLRFRADTRINAIIRSEAAADGAAVNLLDSEAILGSQSSHGLPGSDLFLDHVHFKPRGNYLLARELFKRIAASFAVQDHSANAEQELSEEECERLLALTPIDRARIGNEMFARLQKAPFINQSNHLEHLRDIAADAAPTARSFEEIDAQYRWALQQSPNDQMLHLNYGYLLYGRFPAAANREFMIAQPYDGVPFMRYAR